MHRFSVYLTISNRLLPSQLRTQNLLPLAIPDLTKAIDRQREGRPEEEVVEVDRLRK